MGRKSIHSVRICSVENGEWQSIHSGWGYLCRRAVAVAVLDSCVQFLGDYKQLDLFDWIVKIEVIYGTSVLALCTRHKSVSV